MERRAGKAQPAAVQPARPLSAVTILTWLSTLRLQWHNPCTARLKAVDHCICPVVHFVQYSCVYLLPHSIFARNNRFAYRPSRTLQRRVEIPLLPKIDPCRLLPPPSLLALTESATILYSATPTRTPGAICSARAYGGTAILYFLPASPCCQRSYIFKRSSSETR